MLVRRSMNDGIVGASLGIYQIIDMVAHCHEQVEEDFPPDATVSRVVVV
jgi:hypothetical protein